MAKISLLVAVAESKGDSAHVGIPNDHTIDESYDGLLQGLGARKLVVELQPVLKLSSLLIDFLELPTVEPDASTLIAHVDLNRCFRIIDAGQRNEALRANATGVFRIVGDVQVIQSAGQDCRQFFPIEPTTFAFGTDVHLGGFVAECPDLKSCFSAFWTVRSWFVSHQNVSEFVILIDALNQQAGVRSIMAFRQPLRFG